MSEVMEIQDNASDGEIEGQNASHATARNTADNVSLGNDFGIGQAFHDSTYFNYRSYVAFNVPNQLSGTRLLSAKLRMVLTQNFSATDFDIQIVSQDWSGDISANMEADYDGCLAGALEAVWRNTSGIAINTPYESPALDLSRIIAGATVYYSLRSSRDKNNNTPAGDEFISINAKNYRTSDLWPTLLVEFERPVKAATFF